VPHGVEEGMSYMLAAQCAGVVGLLDSDRSATMLTSGSRFNGPIDQPPLP
jgi:hypothetical protein